MSGRPEAEGGGPPKAPAPQHAPAAHPQADDPRGVQLHPDEPARSHAEATQRARKARDAGLILPIFGCVALAPPVAWIFAIDGMVLGVPLVAAYVFAVWAALILGARGIARRIESAAQPPDRAGP